MNCLVCNKRAYSEYCVAHKPRKPISTHHENGLRQRKPLPQPKRRIKQRGKKTLEYEQWRDEVARPYLDTIYGHVCAIIGCSIVEDLHVDHIQNRGSHPELKMSLANVQYLCFDHHSAKTDRIKA